MTGPRVDLSVLMVVWVLCVTTDWSTATKVALNIAAVTGLCLHEYLVHRRLRRASRSSAGAAVRSTGSSTASAGSRSIAAV